MNPNTRIAEMKAWLATAGRGETYVYGTSDIGHPHSKIMREAMRMQEAGFVALVQRREHPSRDISYLMQRTVR